VENSVDTQQIERGALVQPVHPPDASVHEVGARALVQPVLVLRQEQGVLVLPALTMQAKGISELVQPVLSITLRRQPTPRRRK
jgi:hypothetical protein